MKIFQIPASFADLSNEELVSFIGETNQTVAEVAANPAEYVSEDFAMGELMDETTAAVAAIEEAKGELASRGAEEPEPAEPGDEPAPDAEPAADEAAATADAFAELAGRAATAADEAAAIDPVDDVVTVETTEAAVEVEVEPEAEPITAAAPKPRAALARPSRARRATPAVPAPTVELVALTAAAEGLGIPLGAELGGTPEEAARRIATMMVKRRSQFGAIPEGTRGETIPIAKADWSDLYPAERTLVEGDLGANFEKIQTVTASAVIARAMETRKKEGGSLTASGGLCAPVTPYYQLQMLSTADRPVRAALPSFNADRGGIQFARPAALGAITTAVGIITEAEDSAGGSSATKTCQVIACPPFSTVLVDAIYHCLQFGNLGARAFPELVAQWQDLVLAAHARTAETALLDGIDAASTQVTASNALGLGASATLPTQIIVAADGMRSRNRMAPEAVLRVLLPFWVLDLLVSDVYRSQFERFDMGPNDFVALLRQHNIEPSFYLDGETGGAQVFGAQTASSLLPFPATVKWYLYPEGSFLYVDGGVLELGLVRDSVLNATNDFQIFGETWENVAFVGIESLAVTSTTCDSGTVSLPHAVTCPISYA